MITGRQAVFTDGHTTAFWIDPKISDGSPPDCLKKTSPDPPFLNSDFKLTPMFIL